MIYLDANATTPLLPEVLEAMLPWLRDGFANPSGAYTGAKLARKAIDQARGQLGELIGADAGEILFTGGGTESVNTALHSLDQLAGQGTAVVSAIWRSNWSSGSTLGRSSICVMVFRMRALALA